MDARRGPGHLGLVGVLAATLAGGCPGRPCRAPAEQPRAATSRAAASQPAPATRPSVAASAPTPHVQPLFRGGNRRRGQTPYALPTRAPTIRWRHRFDRPVFASPAIDRQGRIFVGSLDGTVACLAPDGTEQWRRPVGGRVFSSPTLAGDDVVLGTDQDVVLRLSGASGDELWRYQLGPCATGPGLGPDSVKCDADASAALGLDGTLYVGGDALYALRPDGKLRWRVDLGGHLFSSPALDAAGRLYVGTQANTVAAISARGEKLWEFASKGDCDATPALADDKTLVIGCDGGHLYALSTADGALRWKLRTWRPVRSSAAVDLKRGTVLVGTDRGRLLAVDLASGKLRWRFPTGGPIRSSPLVDARGNVVFGSQDDQLYAVDPGGKLLWKVRLGADVDSSAALAPDGTLYIGADDGYLYALH